MKPPLPFVVLALALHVGILAVSMTGSARPSNHSSAPAKRDSTKLVSARQLATVPAKSTRPFDVPVTAARTKVALAASTNASELLAPTPPVPVAEGDQLPEATTINSARLDDYLPRSMLTLAPAPAEPVLIPFPPDGPQGRHVFILALYVDEAGLVRQVRIEDGAQPSELAEVARNAFLATRFAPGQLDDQFVKSRIRVEVVFENRPLDVELAQY